MSDVTDFTIVDHTGDADFYLRFLDQANRQPAIWEGKAIMLDALSLRHGMHALDVGCGLGADVQALAERVGGDGRAFGIDVSAAMISEARRRTAGRSEIELLNGDAHALPFPDERFDAVRAERLLMHLPDAGQALSEMVRVTKRGGRLSVFDFDWDTFVIDSDERRLTREVVRSFCDHMKNGWIGRALPRMTKERGIANISVRPYPVTIDFEFFELLLGGHLARLVAAGTLSHAEISIWSRTLTERARAGTFFAGFTAFIVSGQKH